MNNYDAIVIGAGNGGLTTAATLAQNGKKVLLLERHNIPGGCATSFCRGRFEFEVALHQLSSFGTQENPGHLQQYLNTLDGVVQNLEWVYMDNLYRIVLPGQLDITFSVDKEKTKAALIERFPKEKQSIEKFFEFIFEFYHQYLQIMICLDPESSKEKYPLYYENCLRTAKEVLDEYFDDDLIKLALSIYWTYTGLTPEKMPFGDIGTVLPSYMCYNPVHLKGGSQALSNELVNHILRYGGEVLFNAEVKSIVVEDGKATGVITNSGKQYNAPIVVSNANTFDTLINMVGEDKVPAASINAMSSKTFGPSAFTLYIGLDCHYSEVGITEATNFICKTANPEEDYNAMHLIDTEIKSFLLSCYSHHDSDAAPEGASQLAVVCLNYAEPWMSVPPSEYYDTKFKMAEKLLKRVDEVFPGLSKHIEEIEIATPITHMRYLGSPSGSIYGFDQYAKDGPIFSFPFVTDIKGLYTVGSWAGYGGFEPTLEGGINLANMLLRGII